MRTGPEVIRLYDRERHRDHAYYFGGHDARMCARSFHARPFGVRVCLIKPAHVLAPVADARELGHVFSLAHAMQRAGLTMMLLNDTAACRTIAEELYPLAERNRFLWQLADAMFFRGWLASLAGDFETGFEQMTHAINQGFNPGFRPPFLLKLAERALAVGQIDRAIAVLEQAGEELQSHTNHFCEPEVFRLRGEVALIQSPAIPRKRSACSKKPWHLLRGNPAIFSNCAPASVWQGCGVRRAGATRGSIFWRRFTSYSKKVSGVPICRPRRRCLPTARPWIPRTLAQSSLPRCCSLSPLSAAKQTSANVWVDAP